MHRKRMQKQRIDNRENGGAGADTQRQGEYGKDRKGGRYAHARKPWRRSRRKSAKRFPECIAAGSGEICPDRRTEEGKPCREQLAAL